MDKSSQSSGDSTITTSNCSSFNNRDQYLKQLNKISHKISKPHNHRHNDVFTTSHFRNQPPATLDHHEQQLQQQPPQPPATLVHHEPPLQQQQPPQPPVYNINKNDFREVVQRLTGSPAYERVSNPPPINPPKPQSSRLQRIRPPPLAQISNRPPPLLNTFAAPPSSLVNPIRPTSSTSQRPPQPLSPLPPFPAVHAASESPISAYMRYLRGSISAIDSDHKRFSGPSPLAPLASPKWNNLTQPRQHLLPPPPPPLLQNQQPNMPPHPSSSLPFSCIPSPKSPYPLLSPSLLFSPTGQLGFQQLPLSPTLPVPSHAWSGL